MMTQLIRWFQPPPALPLKSPEEVRRLYPAFRWQVFEVTFVAYAAYYLVRNNLAPVQLDIGGALNYDKSMLGSILAGTAGAYGVGKFIMSYFADRADARKFLVVGLVLASLLNFAFGTASSFTMQLALWALNGFVQGMGAGPCMRSLAHWYSIRERGMVFGFWNICHNVGGALAGIIAVECTAYFGWRSAFYVPGALSLLCAVYVFFRMRDTPQSVGLPPIEEYSGVRPPGQKHSHERDLSVREIFFGYILPNKALWLVAMATFFVHIARYSVVDWGPTYLREAKGASLMAGGIGSAAIEIAGIFGMLAMGWASDRVGGRRGMLSALSMIPLGLGFVGLIYAPGNMLWLNIFLFALIGFFVFGPLMLMGVMSLDFTSKKAVATAGGFISLFGYLGRMVQGQGLGWIAQHYGWKPGLYCVVGCILVGFTLLTFTWNARPRG